MMALLRSSFNLSSLSLGTIGAGLIIVIVGRLVAAFFANLFWTFFVHKKVPILKYMIISMIAIVVLRIVCGSNHSWLLDIASFIGICWFLTKDQQKLY
jgi:hypothetical protein